MVAFRKIVVGLGARGHTATGSLLDIGAIVSSRVDAERGYGTAVIGDRFPGTPNVGFGLSDTARDHRIGWRLTSAAADDPGFSLGLDVTPSRGHRRRGGQALGHVAQRRPLVRGGVRFSCPAAVPPPPPVHRVRLPDGHDRAARLADNPGGALTVFGNSGVSGAFGGRRR